VNVAKWHSECVRQHPALFTRVRYFHARESALHLCTDSVSLPLDIRSLLQPLLTLPNHSRKSLPRSNNASTSTQSTHLTNLHKSSPTPNMSENNPIDSWRDVTGIGHGQTWGAPTSYTSDARAWGAALKQTVNGSSASPFSQKSTLSTVSAVSGNKGLNAEAPVFVPGGGMPKD
jgi:hypothetical protein